jgi:hypothetical protein
VSRAIISGRAVVDLRVRFFMSYQMSDIGQTTSG